MIGVPWTIKGERPDAGVAPLLDGDRESALNELRAAEAL